MSASNPRPGDTIAERYRVIGEIGQGGMGAVFRVEHTMMAKEMAMKLLRPELSGIAEVAERFEREAKSAARLDHHHIVRVTDFGKTESGALFLVMELLEGKALTSLLADQNKLEANEAILLIDQVLEALEHAHSHGVIHRDLKPDNVMLVEKDGRRLVKLLDFGLAKITETKLAEGKQLTTAGTVFGTPRYMSPEQASGEHTDHRADLYSAGVMLFELVSGKPPFAGQSTVDVLRMHLTQPPPLLDVVGLDQDQQKSLDAVIQKAMAKAPKDRYQDAASFRREVLSCLVGTDPAVLEKTHQRAAEVRFASITLGPPSRTWLPRIPSLPMPLVGGGIAALAAIGILAFTITSGGAGVADLEDALGSGDIPRAQQLLDEMREAAPDDPRIPLYEGHLAFEKNELKEALDAYTRAYDQPTPEIDQRLEANLIELMKSRPKSAEAFVKMIASDGGAESSPLLIKLVEEGTNPLLRRLAYEGVVRNGMAEKLKDPVGMLAEDLRVQSNKHCTVRKWYVEQLIGFEDDRVLDALEAERNRRGNFLQQTFGRGVNRCMGTLLDSEISKRKS